MPFLSSVGSHRGSKSIPRVGSAPPNSVALKFCAPAEAGSMETITRGVHPDLGLGTGLFFVYLPVVCVQRLEGKQL